MMIEQEKFGVDDRENEELKTKKVVKFDVKKVVIGAGARFLFYPTLLYNVLRYKIESDFRWWDQVDQFLLLGAVPFPKDVARLKQAGVGGVITLNEPFETLVPPSMYKAHGMEHLVVPTRDYLYAPSIDDINKAVDFIHENASCGRATYVHCKAGRGRSTTIALCYLVKYKGMSPCSALDLIQEKRPRVLLTSMQAKAVQQYYRSFLPVLEQPPASDEALETQSDIEGYKEISETDLCKKEKTNSKGVRIFPVATTLSSVVSTFTIAFSCVSFRSLQQKQSTRLPAS